MAQRMAQAFGLIRKPIMLMGHMDVVEAKAEDWAGTDPFHMVEKDGYYYGRATIDMKDGITAITQAMINLKKAGFTPKRDIVVLFTGDEETNGIGAQKGAATNFNFATQARRQAGSSFKAFTLATAVHQGISLLSRWNGPPSLVITDPRCQTPDPETNVPGPWDVSNYADESAGTMSLLDATANSVNTIFSQVVLDVGPDQVADMARRMGVAHRLDPVCSITREPNPGHVERPERERCLCPDSRVEDYTPRCSGVVIMPVIARRVDDAGTAGARTVVR